MKSLRIVSLILFATACSNEYFFSKIKSNENTSLTVPQAIQAKKGTEVTEVTPETMFIQKSSTSLGLSGREVWSHGDILKGCTQKILIKHLVLAKTSLDSNSNVQFTLSDRGDQFTATTSNLFLKGYKIINNELESFSVSLMNNSLTPEKDTFYTFLDNNKIICDGDNAYVLLRKFKVQNRNIPGHQAFQKIDLNSTSLFKVDLTQNGALTLSKLKDFNNLPVSLATFANGFIYTTYMENGQLIVSKIDPNNLNDYLTKIYHIHHGNVDHVVTIAPTPWGELIIAAKWFHDSKNQFEIIKLNQDLQRTPEFITDNATAGDDQVSDALLSGLDIISLYRIYQDEDDLFFPMLVVKDNIKQSLIVAVDNNNGELDSKYFASGIERLPLADSLNLFVLGENFMAVYSDSTKSAKIRLFNKEGHLIPLNGQKDYILKTPNIFPIDVDVHDDTTFTVYYTLGGVQTEASLGSVRLKIPKL